MNARVDQLAKGAAYGEYDKKSKFTTVSEHPPPTTGDYPMEVNMVEANDGSEIGEKKGSWMDLLIDYLTICKEPKDKNQARKLRIKAARYTILDGVLYQKSFSGPLLRCLTKEESEVVLKSIHSGVCGNYSGG